MVEADPALRADERLMVTTSGVVEKEQEWTVEPTLQIISVEAKA